MKRSRVRLLLSAALESIRPADAQAIRHFLECTAGELTIAHVIGRHESRRAATVALRALTSEGLGHRAVRSVLLEGADAAESVAALVNREAFDLVMCPSVGRPPAALTRWLRPSFRAELLHRSATPLWSGGRAAASARAAEAPRNIGWLVDFAAHPGAQAAFVTALAMRFDARVLLMDVIPPVDEGTPAVVFGQARPLTRRTSMDAMQAVLTGTSVEHAAVVGERWREVGRLVADRHLDLLVVHRSDTLGRVLWRTFPAALDRLPCPVVCLPASPLRTPPRRARAVGAAAQPAPPFGPERSDAWSLVPAAAGRFSAG